MKLSLPELSPRELVELTTPEILRRTVELKIQTLQSVIASVESGVVSALAKVDRDRLMVSQWRDELKGWEGILARLVEPAAPQLPCSLCERGEGCDGPC